MPTEEAITPEALIDDPSDGGFADDAGVARAGIDGRLRGLSDLTDIHLHVVVDETGNEVLDEQTCLVFPGPKILDDPEEIKWVRLLYERVKHVSRSKKSREFSVRFVDEHTDVAFRAQKVNQAIDGVWYRLRRSSTERVSLDTLPLSYPLYVENLLMEPGLCNGGLILISGPPGSGKTTGASATVVSRLEKFGGFAYTIEDPPEILYLNGMHGKGYCTQTEVYPGGGGWSESIKDLLRSQPVSSNLMLYLGEIRDVSAALEMIRAAGNGFLVIATIHASNVVDAVGSVFNILAQNDSRNSISIERFASVLKLAIYQKLTMHNVQTMEAQALYSEDSNSMVANSIRARQINRLNDIVHIQKNRLILQRSKESQAQP